MRLRNQITRLRRHLHFAEDSDAILTGVIDLLFGHEEGWRIIDYKTDVGSTDLWLPTKRS